MVGGGGARQLPRVLPLAGQAEDQLPTVGDGEWLGGGGEHDNYHEFCRLLGRLKTNYQLSELVSGEPTNCQSW